MSDPIELGTVERTRHDQRADPTEPAPSESTESRVATAAGESAERVSGVHHLGGAVARGLDRASRRVLGTSTRPGVTVSKEDGVTTVDIDLVVEYPHPVGEVLDAVREQVQRVAEPVAGGHVVVNVAATDVHGPFDPVETLEEDGEPLVDQARRAASDAGDSAKEAAGRARDAVSGAVESARGSLADAADDAADALDRAADEQDERNAEADRRAAEEDDSDSAARTHSEPAVVETAEFVVRVEVEPVDDSSSATVEVTTPGDSGDSDRRVEETAASDTATDDARTADEAGRRSGALRSDSEGDHESSSAGRE